MDSCRIWLARDCIIEAQLFLKRIVRMEIKQKERTWRVRRKKGEEIYEAKEYRTKQKERREIKTGRKLRRKRRRNGGSHEIKRRESHWGPRSIAIIRLSSRCPCYCFALFIGPWQYCLAQESRYNSAFAVSKLSCRKKWIGQMHRGCIRDHSVSIYQFPAYCHSSACFLSSYFRI